MSDVLSRILGGLMGGGGAAGGGSSPLGVPRLPSEEAGRRGGAFGGMAPGGLGGGMGGGLGGLAGMLGGGGGLGAILGGLLGGRGGMGGGLGGGGLGGVGGNLGGMKGIALIALLAYLMQGRGGASGLSALADRLRGAGLGPQVDSWIGNGQNQSLAPAELERAIPPDVLNEIGQHTGLGRDEVLSQLSRGLPGMVHQLTPEGRLPERDEELHGHDESELLRGFGIGPIRRT